MFNLEPQYLFVIFAVFVIIASILVVLGGIFSVVMLRDCLNRNVPKRNHWLIIITLLNIIGASIYYYRIKRHF